MLCSGDLCFECCRTVAAAEPSWFNSSHSSSPSPFLDSLDSSLDAKAGHLFQCVIST